jgi:hypothetical protein
MGTTYFTQPAEATLAFPPEGYELPYMPTLHVRNGAPSPTVSQCAFPALSCPTSDTLSIRLTRGGVKGPSPDNIELHFWQGPNDIPDDDPDEAEAESCSISDEEEDPDDDPDDTGEPDTPEEPGVEPPVIPPPVEYTYICLNPDRDYEDHRTRAYKDVNRPNDSPLANKDRRFLRANASNRDA